MLRAMAEHGVSDLRLILAWTEEGKIYRDLVVVKSAETTPAYAGGTLRSIDAKWAPPLEDVTVRLKTSCDLSIVLTSVCQTFNLAQIL